MTLGIVGRVLRAVFGCAVLLFSLPSAFAFDDVCMSGLYECSGYSILGPNYVSENASCQSSGPIEPIGMFGSRRANMPFASAADAVSCSTDDFEQRHPIGSAHTGGVICEHGANVAVGGWIQIESWAGLHPAHERQLYEWQYKTLGGPAGAQTCSNQKR